MSQWYWISEYLRLMLAYGFVLYVWPTVVFEKHLRGRRLAYRFGFCATVPVLLVNTLVLVLGLLHILRPWVTGLLFLGVFFWRLFVNHPPLRGTVRDVQVLFRDTMSPRRLLLRTAERLRKGLTAWFAPVRERVRDHKLEYALLLLLLVFGTIYFSYGAMDEHVYGCGDQYVHHQWTYGLTEGHSFVSGIYPEAMHCMIFLTCTLFRIPLYTGILFLAGIHVHVLLISAWLFMKEVFRWRYSPLAALAMFLCFNEICATEVFAISRLGWTLPMEYAMFTVFLSGTFLLRFLKRVLRGERIKLHPLKPRQWSVLRDQDLFLFSAALSVSLAVHFYDTIIAFFFCIVIAAVYVRQVFRKGSFLPLAAAVCLGFFVAVAPMGAAFAAGYPLQGSLYWAMNVMKADKTQEAEPQVTSDGLEPADTESAGGPSSPAEPVSQETFSSGTGSAAAGLSSPPSASRQTMSALKDKARILYDNSYDGLYPGVRAKAILTATAFALATALPAHILLTLWDFRRRRRVPAGETPPAPAGDALDGVLITALQSVVFMTLYSASALHLPSLLEGVRICVPLHVMLVMLYAVPLDYLMALLTRVLGDRAPGKLLTRAMAAAAVFGVYAFAQLGGIFHSYTNFEISRFNAAVETTCRIIQTLPPQKYTVISTTEELYQVIETGYHEELLTFLEREYDGTYTIPTPYLLLYIEKHPLYCAQHHFAAGPRWLAWEDYPAVYPGTSSQCPDLLKGEISPEAAAMDIFYGQKLSDSASTMEGRTILESKAYEWYQTFSAMHPRSCRVIYEDEDFMCCCITQNPYSLFTLGIMEQTERGV